MIDRAILNNPNKPFDFFNDYNDTIRWLKIVNPASVPLLEERYKNEVPSNPKVP